MNLLQLFETNQDEYQIQLIADAFINSSYLKSIEQLRANQFVQFKNGTSGHGGDTEMFYRVEKLDKIIRPEDMGHLYDAFKNINFQLDFYFKPEDLPDFGGQWHSKISYIVIPFGMEWKITSGLDNLKSIIIHELRHALDAVKSSGDKYHRKGYVQDNEEVLPDYDQHHLNYMRSQHEVNARFSQLLGQLEDKIHEMMKTVDKSGRIKNQKENRQAFRRNIMIEIKPFIDKQGLGIFFKTNDKQEANRRADLFNKRGTRYIEFDGMKSSGRGDYDQSKSLDDPRYRRLMTRIFKYAEERTDLMIRYRFDTLALLEKKLNIINASKDEMKLAFDKMARVNDLQDFEMFEMNSELLLGPYLVDHTPPFSELDEYEVKYIKTCDDASGYLQYLYDKAFKLERFIERIQRFTKKQNILDLDDQFAQFRKEHIEGTKKTIDTINKVCNLYFFELDDLKST